MPSQQLPGFRSRTRREVCLEFEVGFRTAKEKETKGGKGGGEPTPPYDTTLCISFLVRENVEIGSG